MPAGFHWLIAAQFCSALSDNALLIVTIALLEVQGLPGWWAPLLKLGATLAHVVLAPWLGVLADAMPKARLMAWMNGLKTVGVLGLLSGWHPVLAFAVVGLGAAAYAPAKYGLITELVPASRLVTANAWIEVSVVAAVLLGMVSGGALVGPGWSETGLVTAIAQVLGTPTDRGAALVAALLLLLGLYLVAGLLNLGVPDSGARYPALDRHPARALRAFGRAQSRLWQDADGRLSLTVTTLFWGVGATLQFAVLDWGTQVLDLSLEHAAYLQASVAVGVVVGAVGVSTVVTLGRAHRVLPAGVVLGSLVALAPALVSTVGAAVPVLMLVGAVGGVLVVPLNALLQHRGHELLSAGRSIAVQGCNENASVLAFLAGYAVLKACAVPIVPLMMVFGTLLAMLMAVLSWQRFARALPQTSG